MEKFRLNSQPSSNLTVKSLLDQVTFRQSMVKEELLNIKTDLEWMDPLCPTQIYISCSQDKLSTLRQSVKSVISPVYELELEIPENYKLNEGIFALVASVLHANISNIPANNSEFNPVIIMFKVLPELPLKLIF